MKCPTGIFFILELFLPSWRQNLGEIGASMKADPWWSSKCESRFHEYGKGCAARTVSMELAVLSLFLLGGILYESMDFLLCHAYHCVPTQGRTLAEAYTFQLNTPLATYCRFVQRGPFKLFSQGNGLRNIEQKLRLLFYQLRTSTT